MPILIAAVVLAGLLYAVAQSQKSQSPQPSSAASAAEINQLLLAIQDPSWQEKVQAALMSDSDALSLDIMAATLSVGEPSGAAVLRLKVAALQGKPSYAPPPLPTVVNSPQAYDLFASGQYQGCDATPSCNPAAAVYGSGPGPMGLDATAGTLEDDGLECISYLLQAYPDSFAKEFSKSVLIQGDPTSALAQTLSAVESVVRSAMPITATSLRYKQAFLLANKVALNAQALAVLRGGAAPMTGSTAAAAATATATLAHATATPTAPGNPFQFANASPAPGLAQAAVHQALSMSGFRGTLSGPTMLPAGLESPPRRALTGRSR